MESPFSRILAAHAGDMSPGLFDQYLSPAGAPYEVVLAGTMERVWHRPAWLWPVFWLLSRWDLFFPETGENIPTTLVITTDRDSDGTPFQTWERTFLFPGVERRYRSVMRYDAETNRIVELQGPGDILRESAEIRFELPGTLQFITVESCLKMGPVRVPLPRVLWVHGHVHQVVEDPESGRTRVSLLIRHNLLGPVFGYEGVFRPARRDRKELH